MGQRVIQVNQHRPDGGTWDLADFLRVLENDAGHLKWMITSENEITFSSPREYILDSVMTYTEMVDFAEGIFQTIWGLFLCDSEPGKLVAYDRTQYLDHQANQLDIEIALEMVDSSYWLVSAKSEAVLRRVEEHFKE